MPTLHKVIRKIAHTLVPPLDAKEVARWYRDDPHETRRFEYPLEPSSIVFDVGGYKGQWASDIYARYSCAVNVFEPVLSFAEYIEKRFSKNPKIQVFPFGLGDRSRSETIALNEDGSSIYRKSNEIKSIQICEALEFFEANKIDRLDLIKINTEGGEYELLPHLIQTGLVAKIHNIQVQFHRVDESSEIRMRSICEALALTHKPTYQYKFVWENWALRI